MNSVTKLFLRSSLFFATVAVLVGAIVSGCATREPSVLRKQVSEVDMTGKKSDGSPRKRLMVFPFLDEKGVHSEELRNLARTEFIRELGRTGEVIVLDSKDLKGDYAKSMSNGEYNLTEVAKGANQLGANAVLEGKLMALRVQRQADPVGVFRQLKTKFEAVARVRIVAARTGKELFNTEKTISLEEANYRVAEKVESDRFFQNNPELVEKLVSEAFLDFTPQILAALDKMNWEGRIALVNGDRIFLNVGRISGLQLGDLLRVSEDGDEIYDPQSGGYIGKVPGRNKGTLEVVSYFGQDGAIAVVHSGAGFRENDKVEIYY